ncbi:MAG: hypothetical protein WCD18_19750 [Thermosynechococcaceae cyanobacterium]
MLNRSDSDLRDLAGQHSLQPTYFSTRARINRLVDRFLSVDVLSDRLSDLPSQFDHPHQRPWEPIHWKQVSADQIIGVDRELFVQIISSAAEIEAPIRDYAQESWAYLHPFHPQMAQFIGGELSEDAQRQSVGIWEKEERQHTPVMRKLYQQLTGETFQPKPNTVSGYEAGDDPVEAVYQHLCARISTEWSAIAVYLWLMSHSTGDLQQAIAQLLQDEVNHLAKFWGFSRWAFGNSAMEQLTSAMQDLTALIKHHKSDRTNGQEMTSIPQLVRYLPHVVELGFTFTRVMVRIKAWDRELTQSYLKHLFGLKPVFAMV